jgi:hypothetical protein
VTAGEHGSLIFSKEKEEQLTPINNKNYNREKGITMMFNWVLDDYLTC